MTDSPILKAALAEKMAAFANDMKLDLKQTSAHEPVASANDEDVFNPFRVCGDGERTDHLTRLAGRFIREGKSLATTINLCIGWNKINNPPLPEEKVRSTCKSIFETHVRNHGGKSATAPVTPLFELEDAGVAHYLTSPPPPQEWLVQDLLPRGVVGLVVGSGGSSKSMLALQLGVAIAAGRPFWGRSTPNPGSVVFLCAEDDNPQIHRRVHAICADVCEVSELEALMRRLYIKSLVGQNNLMTEAKVRGEVTRTAFVDRVLLTLRQVSDLRLVVIDPASRFRGGDENTAQDATRFVEEAERLHVATGATVLIIHHANKGASSAEEASQAASRGSSALTDGARWQMNLNPPSRNDLKNWSLDPDDRLRYVVATVTKNNYGPPQKPTLLYRADFGVLQAVTAGRDGSRDKVAEIIELLQAERKNGRTFTQNAFAKQFGGENGPLRIGDGKLRRILKEAVQSNRLRLEKGNKLLAA